MLAQTVPVRCRIVKPRRVVERELLLTVILLSDLELALLKREREKQVVEVAMSMVTVVEVMLPSAV